MRRTVARVGARIRALALCAGVVAAAAPPAAVADPGPAPPELFEVRSRAGEPVVLGWSTAALAARGRDGRPFVVERFPLALQLEVDLELERFSVTGPGSRFVVGRKGRPDEPFEFDASSITAFRGSVRGRPGSSVFLGFADKLVTGRIDLGPGGDRFRLSSRDGGGRSLERGTASVFRATAAPTLPPGVPLCGEFLGGARPTAAPGRQPGQKHLQLAVETDHEFFELFGNLDDAAAYLALLYTEVSDIYLRDVDVRVELVFARLWSDPDDLFDTTGTSPLSSFRAFWNSYMTAVQRDVAQFLSGQRTFPFGGQAYINALCGSNAYSVVGYAMGFFPDPQQPSPYHYDIEVTAHELGHNSGSLHTQDYGIDDCADPESVPQRGTIMSYCGQTWSGGNADQDLYFHRLIQPNIDAYIAGAACIADDCNQNGVPDAADIQSTTSVDANLDGIPDECQDCNANSVLDPQDISGATSQDQNQNGLPDECEPDCNANSVPDDRDIADETSLDAHGNDVPDECEVDCNANGQSDYSEIQTDMTLDVDRNARLDACQDCDGDGTSDHDELDSAHYLWVASGLNGSPLRQFFPSTGVETLSSSGALVQKGHDLLVAPGGHVLVASGGDDRVLEFNRAGTYLGDLVPPGRGGLDEPAGLVVTPANRLLVASRNTHSVLSYDAADGAFVGVFVAAGSGGLLAPFGLALGPSGNLFVTSGANEILEYDGASGSFVGVLVSTGSGGLSDPRGLLFKPDGNLLVASFGTSEVLEYDGTTGAALGKWAKAGTSTVLTQTSPWGLRIGPNGNVFVTRTGATLVAPGFGSHHQDDHGAAGRVIELHLTNAQIYEYDVRNGNYLRALVSGNDHHLVFPTAFDFFPGWEIDCNDNQLPDECDVSSEASNDADANGVPDECQRDCNGNGTFDRLDVLPYGPALDCNGNLSPDACDVADGVSQDCTGNGIPDECEPDCNGNGVADGCDLQTGAATDCNDNGVPDECDVYDDLEAGASGWLTSALGDDASAGLWLRINPNGTAAQPDFDHTPGGGRMCFVTGQSPPSSPATTGDVDGGKTTLTSPPLDLTSYTDPEIGYWRWFSNHTGADPGTDLLTIDVSSDGQNWVNVEVVGPTGSQAAGGWFFHAFRVADFVSPTTNVRLRFVAADLLADSNLEAAIDDLVILPYCCEPPLAVANVRVLPDGSWTWAAQAGAVYDVAGGWLMELAADQSVGAAQCLADDLALSPFTDTRPDPLPGAGYYYLVRAERDCGAGGYGTASGGAERLPTVDCP